MKFKVLAVGAVLVLGVALNALAVPPGRQQSDAERIYLGVTGTIALENDHVLVQRFFIPPGQSTGHHAHAGHQLLVFIKGGVLTSDTGKATIWPDGRVVWLQEAGQDGGGTNSGRTPIELVWVTLKPQSRAASAGNAPKYGYLNYPRIPGEDVLENDDVIVQRYKMDPGDWEGIHAHNANTFYIFIKGGQWLSKSRAYPLGVRGSAGDGLVAWMDPIELSDDHQSGNVGTTSTEVVWVALKK